MRFNFRDAAFNWGRLQRGDSVTSAIGPLGSNAIYFDGNNVNPTPVGITNVIGASDAANLAFPGDFTFEGYVQMETAVLADDKGIFYHNAGWAVMRRQSTGKMTLYVAGADRIVSTTTIEPGTNYKWSVTRISGVCTLRVNGVAEGGTYTNAVKVSSGGFVWLGGVGSANAGNIKGFIDEVALYTVGKYTANYTPTFAEVPEGSSNPHWDNILLLLHGDYAASSSTVAVAPPIAIPLFEPNWPAHVVIIDPVIRILVYGGNGRVAGTIKIKGTPDIPVRRKVRLIREIDAVCIDEQWSDAATGAYDFIGVDPNFTYTVLTYDGPRVFRASVQDGVVPVAWP